MKNQFPNIPTILPQNGSIPPGYRLMVHKWSYPEDRIGETVTIGGREVKKLLTLDVNIPEAGFGAKVNAHVTGSPEARSVFVKNYPCPHACPGCFNNATLENPIMTLSEVMRVIDDAKGLGLESIKFLGPGELLANPDLWKILDFLLERDIVIGIFTKAAIMGNDALAQHYHGVSSQQVVDRLVSYPNTTFLVGGRSFDPEFENRFIPQNTRQYQTRFNYHGARNLAIERLAKAGMNSDLLKQRLEIACAPVTHENIESVLELYQWATERNIPVVAPPTMISGKGHKLEESASELSFENDYIELAVQVYKWTIDRGVMTLDQFSSEGAHPYIGIAPCNQLTHGLYVHYDGQVWRCPGNDTPDFVVHNDVRTSSLVDIWTSSKNYKINKFNNRCVKDGFSVPHRFYREVMRRVCEQF
jgi:MoaA/NifB/PqqE/SkfB family radical SAM enzyme